MAGFPDHMGPKDWLRSVLSARAVCEGGVIRRKTRDIKRILGRDRFLMELDRRGFRSMQNGGQTVIFCNAEPERILP